jgi:hypothetical protein
MEHQRVSRLHLRSMAAFVKGHSGMLIHTLTQTLCGSRNEWLRPSSTSSM